MPTTTRIAIANCLVLSCCLVPCRTTLSQDQLSANLSYTESNYGRAMDAGTSGISIDVPEVLATGPITIQVRVKVDRRAFRFDNAILSAGTKSHGPAWSLQTQSRAGVTFALPAHEPSLISIQPSIADSNWHDLAVLLEPDRVQMFLDGNRAADKPIRLKTERLPVTTLWIGQSIDGERTCDGLIDDVAVARGIQPVRNVWQRGPDSLVFLDFEESSREFLSQWTPIKSTRPEAEPWEREDDDDWMDDRFQSMDVGQVLACSTKLPGRRVGPKNLSIKLQGGAQVMFDTQHCVTVAGITSGYLQFHPKRFGILNMPVMEGSEVFYADASRQWQTATGTAAEDVQLRDNATVRFSGYYLHGPATLLAYEVEKTKLLEQCSTARFGETQVFLRNWQITSHLPGPRNDPSPPPGTLGERDFIAVPIIEADSDQFVRHSPIEVLTRVGSRILIARVHRSSSARLLVRGRSVYCVLPRASGTTQVCLAQIDPDQLDELRDWYNDHTAEFHGNQAQKGGPNRWGQPIVTRGVLGDASAGAYVVDTLTLPEDNPYRALMYVSGLDFFVNRTPHHQVSAAICTVHGDVWLVHGIDDQLQNLRWHRFATGLYQPLGLKIVDEQIYVLGRDQITRLKDLNGDGEADFYENFNNDLQINGQGHAFATCLETDPQGNFYFLKSGKTKPHGGKMLRVSKDGSRLDVFASGYRHPNGMGISPDGFITAADNQGNWIPASSIQHVTQGSFHGFMPELHRPSDPYQFDPPIVWLPVVADNSSGGQVWVTSDRWGPFRDQLLHLSWGRCTLMLVMTQRAGQRWQGAAVTFPNVKFSSGAGRARFNPHDGQLYIAGQDGWQTAATQDGCLQRVRYTGGTVRMPRRVSATQRGLHIEFTAPLDRATVADLSRYEIAQWQYRWRSEYGSPEFSISNPNRIGHDRVEISRAEPLEDGRSILLHMPRIQPVQQMQIQLRVRFAAGIDTQFTVYNTIHQLAAE